MEARNGPGSSRPRTPAAVGVGGPSGLVVLPGARGGREDVTEEGVIGTKDVPEPVEPPLGGLGLEPEGWASVWP